LSRSHCSSERPATAIVERTALRKALVVVNSFFSRVFWVVIALLPWFFPEPTRVPLFLVSLFLYFALGSISSCSFSSWMRDFVPEEIMGRYFGKRMAASLAVGAVLTLLAGLSVDTFKDRFSQPDSIYSVLFLCGVLFGLLGVYFLARIPEPRMLPGEGRSVWKALTEPLRERNFRQLLVFLATWNFAVNLAGPFFTVYMLTRLRMSMIFIVSLAVLSQLVSLLFLGLWGRLADRLSNKSVLGVSGPLFIVSIALWPFTTMPEPHFLTLPLITLIHVLAGMSTAGVNLCASNIALKLAPRGRATAYLAANALVSGIAASVAPILTGFSADWFASQEISLTFLWKSDAAARQLALSAISLRGLDFLFLISFAVGIYALHRLLAVQEDGEVEERVVATELFALVRKAVQHVSNVAGLRRLTYFPYGRLRD
jgi:MFS family permease